MRFIVHVTDHWRALFELWRKRLNFPRPRLEHRAAFDFCRARRSSNLFRNARSRPRSSFDANSLSTTVYFVVSVLLVFFSRVKVPHIAMFSTSSLCGKTRRGREPEPAKSSPYKHVTRSNERAALLEIHFY